MALVYGEYGPYDDGQPAASPPQWELSAGGDYRRISRQGLLGGSAVAGPNYYGGAGQMHQYDFQKKNDAGGWDFVNPGEHNEEATYFWAGLNSPGYLSAAQKAEADRTALDTARLSTPGAIGQALTRSEASLTGGSNEDDFRQELAFYTHKPDTVSALSSYYTPGMQSSINDQLSQSTPSAQSARAEADSGGFGDMLPLIALVGIGIATGGFGMFGAGAMTGVEAGVMTAAEAAAAETAAMSAWAAVPAQSGLMGNILTNAAIGAGTSAARGGDPLMGAITGGIGGAAGNFISGTGASLGASGAAATAIDRGLTAAVTGAAGSALQGGSFADLLEAGVIKGITSGAGNYVTGSMLPGSGSTVAAGAGGAVAGGVNAALSGGDIGTGMLTGGAAGAATGYATAFGLPPGAASAIGSVAGGMLGSTLQPDPVIHTTPPPPAPAATATPMAFGLSFSDLISSFTTTPRRDMQWGSRLQGA